MNKNIYIKDNYKKIYEKKYIYIEQLPKYTKEVKQQYHMLLTDRHTHQHPNKQ